MSYADEMGQREVIIDRGAMGFGFTLRLPVTPNRGGDEPTYVNGAPVRSVEEKGPACRGGLDKDEVVTAVNDSEVHGKSFLEVMRIIQASSRRLVLRVFPAGALEQAIVSFRGDIQPDLGMDDTSAEKENQLLHPRAADRRSCMSEPPSSSSPWPTTPPSGSSGDLPSVIAGAPASVSSTPLPDLGDVTTAPVDESLHDFQLVAKRTPSPVAPPQENYSVRPHRASTALVVTTPSSVSTGFGGAKAAGLTRSTGHLFSMTSGLEVAPPPPAAVVPDTESRGPIVTLKKAYQPFTASIPVRDVPIASGEPRTSVLSTSSAGSASTGGVSTRVNFSIGNDGEARSSHPSTYSSVLERTVRSSHSAHTAEPRINFKKRKQSAASSSPTSSPGGLTSSRAQSVGHLPGSQDPHPPRFTPLPRYPAPATGSPLSSKQRFGTSSTHNILTSMPSSSRCRVASPPGEHESGSGTSVGITLMHSPMRRGSSPARSVTAAVTPQGAGEEGEARGSPLYHETRFSMVQDRIVSNLPKPGAPNRVVWHQQGANQPRLQARTSADGGAVSALLTRPTTTSFSSSYHMQEHSSTTSLTSTSSSVTYSTTITSSSRTRNQRARAEFMEAKPIVPPALPMPKVSASPPQVSQADSAEASSSVTRRDSYINAVKTNRATMMSPEAIDEGEEQDDGADSDGEDTGMDQHDYHALSLAKAKRFFGESWTRRSGKNKTPKLKEAIASGGKESLGVGGSGSEKKFNLSVKVVRDDGKEPKSRSWKSFSLTIENDVMYLMRERKESSASSSSSVEELPSPIPLRQCHFEWTAPDVQSRKKYLVCRMVVDPRSPPESTSSVAAASSPPSAYSTPDQSTVALLHGTSPPSTEPGVSEYKLQFLDSEQMQSFYNCLANLAASVNVLTDFPATTYPPAQKATKKSAGSKPKKPVGDFDLSAMTAADLELGNLPSHSGKTKLKALVKNIRGWKSSSTESTSTTGSGAIVSRTMRYEEYSLRQRSVSPEELLRPLPGYTFGVPLTQVPRSSTSPYVPFVVELCTKIVEACGLHCVGVYRVSPKKAVIDALEQELNACGSHLELIDRTNERWNDVHAVSGLLKCFLRRMPDPLFPHSLYRDFVNASNRNQPHERKMLLLQRLLMLMESDESGNPEFRHHRETLLYLVQHLRRVAAHSHVNKMNTKNLASMIAPNVFRPPELTNPAMIMESTTHGATILELVLNHHEWIFSTDIDAARSVPPPVTQEPGHNAVAPNEPCAGEHEGESNASHSNDDALGGAEDTGATNRSDVFEYIPGENGRDILAQLLDAAIRCQNEVSPEAAHSLSDEGGFDEVDIDAAVRRREQLDAAAAAAGAGSGSGDTTPAASGSTNGSGSKPSEDAGGRLAEFSHSYRGSACLPDTAEDEGNAEWRHVALRAETALAASATDLRAGPSRRDAGGRWFGATVHPLSLDAPPPLPPRLYDCEVERRRLGSPSEALEAGGMHRQRQMSKSLDSLTAGGVGGPEAEAAPKQAVAERQVSSPAPQVPPRNAAVVGLRRQRSKAASDGLPTSHLT